MMQCRKHDGAIIDAENMMHARAAHAQAHARTHTHSYIYIHAQSRSQDRARLMAAVQNARVNPVQSAMTAAQFDLPEVEEVEVASPLELVLATGLELLLE